MARAGTVKRIDTVFSSAASFKRTKTGDAEAPVDLGGAEVVVHPGPLL